jgi:hypothetical protein
LLVGEPVYFDRHPVSLAQAGDWLDLADANDEAALVAAVARYDADDAAVASTVGADDGPTLADGDLLFVVPALSRAPKAVLGVELRARVRRNGIAGTAPVFAFVVKPLGAAAPLRVGAFDVGEAWTEVRVLLDQNPDGDVPWTPDTVPERFGLANTAPAGATDELRVSELRLVVLADCG